MGSDPHHWDAVYAARDEDALTWFEAVPDLSLELIRAHAGPEDAVIDVGGGASRLPDALIEGGYRDISVLDLSQQALDISRERLGERADRVDWIAADVTGWRPARSFDLWHDRAVFHFLTDDADRADYLAAMDAALRPGGHAIISSFAPDGPEMCSNLPVQRYSPDSLSTEIEAQRPGRFRRIEDRAHVHVTPKGNRQSFQISVFRKL